MIDAIVRGFLGDWGSTALDFYLQYSLWINTLLLLYALSVVYARRAYHSVLDALITALETEHGGRWQRKRRTQIRRDLKTLDLQWQAGLRASWFPFVTPPNSVRLHVKNVQTLQRLFSADLLADKIMTNEDLP